MTMTRCDQIVQYPHGEDEEGCHIPESARLIMSLFFSSSLFLSFHLYNIEYLFDINIITAGIAVVLTIITYFSTPILTKIFGDGSLEVRELLPKHKKNIVDLFFSRGTTLRTGLITASKQPWR